jgi:cation diffusion facilitator family transporter
MTEPNETAKLNDAETRQIQRIASQGFLLNLGLAVLKALLAVLSGSLAITASAVDSATDVVASLGLYFGLKLSTRKSAVFPLGLYKIENLLSVGVALAIFFAGCEIAKRAFSPSGALPDISPAMISFILAGTVSAFLFGRYAVRAGERTESPTLIAEGKHRQADVLASVVVLISITISYFKIDIDVLGITADQMAAVLVLLFVAHTGWELLSDGMRVLLDASLDHETLERGKGIRVAEWLVSKNVDQVAVVESMKNKGPAYVFSNAGVKIRVVSGTDLRGALASIVAQEGSGDQSGFDPPVQSNENPS